jgi:hypothetical protein
MIMRLLDLGSQLNIIRADLLPMFKKEKAVKAGHFKSGAKF